jgi:hypothetical protein
MSHTSADVSIRQHTSAYVSIRQQTCSASRSEHSRKDVALELQVTNTQLFAIPRRTVCQTQGLRCSVYHVVQRERVHVEQVLRLDAAAEVSAGTDA